MYTWFSDRWQLPQGAQVTKKRLPSSMRLSRVTPTTLLCWARLSGALVVNSGDSQQCRGATGKDPCREACLERLALKKPALHGVQTTPLMPVPSFRRRLPPLGAMRLRCTHGPGLLEADHASCAAHGCRFCRGLAVYGPSPVESGAAFQFSDLCNAGANAGSSTGPLLGKQ